MCIRDSMGNQIGRLYLDLVSSKKTIADLKSRLEQSERGTMVNSETPQHFSNETVISEPASQPPQQQDDKKIFNPLLTKRRREIIEINDEHSPQSGLQEPESSTMKHSFDGMYLDWTTLVD
eukprot:TRINITY_DN15439_c0_g1_i1.p1 TRINITY_DN15439_c0_g1~~TRINITY_DN15439_c0_g1_i1.p1  ORF type:complete len:121 (+),score=17.59 TRINITY_DN15439_c0_g1_i1:63-425(+)